MDVSFSSWLWRGYRTNSVLYSGRGASIEDLVADCIGAGLGILSGLGSIKRSHVESKRT